MYAISENNLGNESSDLNNSINENNSNYKNNSINLNNNNINISDDDKTPKKNQIRIQQKANNNLKPPQITDYQYPELIDITSMENQYNIYINDLKMKLAEAKNERRKKEEEARLIQHRLTLLKNQEQIKLLEFERIKEQISKILNNRIQAQKNMKRKLQERKYFKNSIGPWGKNHSTSIKKNKTISNLFNTRKKNRFMNSSQKDFYRPKKLKNFTIEQNNDEIKDNINFKTINKSIDLNILDINMLKNLSKGPINDKNLIKKQLIEKLKQDEEEKKRIEDEIAKIEEEENKLLNKF
jgi:hypothetical protein